ncbi:neuraminidase-like domain-containing protein [Actinoplanes sp. NPDC049681]|uniref:Tc toxin subunit A-related protein n=1 Tax=Actinoplanes sp. NPDC049681 TaxID=3363905 RepID=UPI00379DEEE5
MRIEYDGLTLIVHHPVPPAADSLVRLVFTLMPAAEDARVDVSMAADEDGARPLAATAVRVEPGGKEFAVDVPSYLEGRRVIVEVQGTSAGRRVPAEDDTRAARCTVLMPAAVGEMDDGEEAGDGRRRGREVLPDLATTATVEERQALFDAGLRSRVEISAQPAALMRGRLGETFAPERADAIHRVAVAQMSLLNQLALDAAPAITGSPSGRCDCDDREAATSPLAYLVDLITYIEASVTVGTGAPLDIARLTSLLRQPLGELVATVEAVSEPVREVRLTVETLRQHLSASGPADADVVCSPVPLPLDFLIGGDIDGDRRDELVVGFRADPASPLPLPPGVQGGFWVMDFDPVARTWSHLRPGTDGAGADVLLDPGLRVAFSCCGDVDGDGRDEVILAVGNADGSVDPMRGALWLWIMRFDPAGGWSHLNPWTFGATGADLTLDDRSAQVVQIVAGDIDGDGADEIVIATTSAALPNAFWVFDLVTLPNGVFWQALSPGLDASLPSFECAPSVAYAPRLVRIADVDAGGRAEIVGLLDAPGADGAAPWAIAYDPPAAGAGAVGTWRHLRGSNPAGPDVPPPWPWNEPAAHLAIARARGGDARLVLTAGAVDPDRIFAVGYDGAAADPWTVVADVDAGAGGARLSYLAAADVDDDGRAEYVAVAEIGGRKMAFVLHRRNDGSWGHLSPIAGNAAGADLEWTRYEHDLAGVVAADVDRPRPAVLDLRQELIFHGRSCNEIWVMSYDPDAGSWGHLSQVTPPDLSSAYLAAAYQALLAQIGTSLEELRALRGADPADRQALADRLGIPLVPDPAEPESLDQLLLSPAEVSEAVLEELFGYADTTRNPLSSAVVPGDTRRQVRGISLSAPVWSTSPWTADVGPGGDLRLYIARVNPPAVQVILARPDGGIVARGEGPPGGRIRLNAEFGRSVSGWIEVDYRQDVTDLPIQAMPKLTAWRLSRLRELWDLQDSPSPAGDGVPVAVDPDVVGPDDFRVPCAKAAGPDRAFDLWLARRKWVDDRLAALTALQPDLDAMFAALRPAPGGGGGAPEDTPWDGAPTPDEFAALAEALTRGTPAEALAAAETVRTALWLPADAFLRMVALSARVRDAVTPPTAAEWAELRSILVVALKRRRAELWRAEEAASGCVVGPAEFWAATRTPAEGEWPPPAPADGVWIDPDTVARADLPAGVAGLTAAGLLRARQRELDGYARAVRAARPDGLEAMVVAALGPAAAGTTWRERIATLGTDLQSTDLTVAAAARAAAAAEFGLDVGPFRRLAAADAALTAGRSPTETEWLDVEAVLTTARKRKLEYPAWVAQEAQLAQLLAPWRARRAALPRWRATADDRLAWELELRQRSRAAVVDPDRFPFGWTRSRGFMEPTSTLYSQRRTWLLQEASRLRAARPAGAELLEQLDAVLRAGLFDVGEHPRLAAELGRHRAAQGAPAVLEEVFGAAAADLPQVRADLDSADPATARAAGRRAARDFWLTPDQLRDVADIAAGPDPAPAADGARFDAVVADAAQVGRIVAAEQDAKVTGVRTALLLAQLGISPAARAQLLRTRAVAIAGGPVLDEEWDTVVAIALRAAKQRRTGEWQRAEAGKVRLGPDSFGEAPVEPSGDEGQPRDWLTTPEEVRWWRDTIAARYDLERTVVAGLRDAVARAEEQALPVLRDRLLAAVSPPDADAPAWVLDHYLIDARMGPCAVTTRAARAIDTLLALLWSLRTGQLRDTYPQLLLDAPAFDQDWRWIGSYASWRSAVLVRLYPENILRPNLRRHRTPAFDELLDAVRSNRQLTAGRARRLAADYAKYFRDVCSLSLASLACARVEQWTRTGDEGATPGTYDFLFATSEASGKLYWSTLAAPGAAADPGYEQSFWQELPGFDGAISSVVGATTYRPSPPTPRAMTAAWVYVFVLTRDLDRQGVAFVRFNLVTRAWESPKDLEPPKNAPEFSAALLAAPPTSPPAMAFTTTRPDAAGNPIRVQFRATMNAKGTAWNNDGVVELAQWRWHAVDGQLAGTPGDLLALDADGDGIAELAAVPPGAGRIAFYAGHATTAVSPAGQTSRAIENGSLVCAGDFNGDRRAEIAWTPAPGVNDISRTTAVFIERLDGGAWVPDRPDPNSPDGASVPALSVPVRTPFLLAGNVDRYGRDELLMPIPASFETEWLPNGTLLYTGTWGSFWSVYGQDQRYRRNAPYTYVPDPDRRTPYDFDVLGSAFTAFTNEVATAIAVTGDFDGDHFDELVVFFAPWVNGGDSNYSLGNDFTAVDVRRDYKMRTFGPVINPDVNTVGDLSTEKTVAAAAFAADVDGDGRDELVVLPYVDDAARGSKVWVWKFHAGGGVDPAEGGYWAALPDLDLSRDMVAVAHGVAADVDGDGAQELLLFGAGRSWAYKYIPVLGTWQPLPDPVAPGATVAAAAAGRFLPGPADRVIVAFGDVQPEQVTDGLSYSWSGATAVRSRYIRTPGSAAVRMLDLAGPPDFTVLPQCAHSGIAPAYTGSGTDWLLDDRTDLAARRAKTRQALTENAGEPASTMAYLWEAFYAVPLALGLALQRGGDHTSALDWFRLVYDYTQAPELRKTFHGLVLDEQTAGGGSGSVLSWLHDPLDADAVAATRPNTYTRGVVQLIVSCLLEAGDAEFTVDTAESIERARLLYGAALELLALPVLGQIGGCQDIIGRHAMRVGGAGAQALVRQAGGQLARVLDGPALGAALDELVTTLPADGDAPEETASRVVAAALAQAPPPRSLADTVALARRPDLAALAARPEVAAALDGVAAALNGTERPAGLLWGHVTGADLVFCVGPNPLLKALRLHAELNLYKIRTCRSIDGLRRSLDFYSAATDQTTGLPMIGADGQLVLTGARQAPPTPYRYAALSARANELARTAQQLEATMFAAIERRDAEAYTVLQARQGARVARENVRVAELQVRTAEDRVLHAESQQNRALVEQGLYSQLIATGDSELEREALDLLQQSIEAQSTAELLGIGATIGYGAASLAYTVAAATSAPNARAAAIGQALSSAAQTLSSAGGVAATQSAIRSAQSQLASTRAALQRVREDWRTRQRLATEDIKIAAQLVQVETDGVRVAEQQRTVSELTADNADRLVDYLDGKFTSVELFDWMSETFERVYSTVLQHATATARMAANQLAFERQEGTPPPIAGDYWAAPPTDGAPGSGEGDGVDRRGLTGAERLLADLVTLDQYAFETQRRKLQLAKTISLAALAPMELEQLRAGGVMTFGTPMELFDRDFPGHYLRMIKRVTVSVVALVPPVEGIHATLSSTGASRIVVGPELFQTITVRRPGQSVALTSPVGSTGVFTFDSQPELANPFEFEGVDTTWELRLPHAGNRFDFRGIADVLLTIDYTALDSADYRDQVVRRLDRRFTAERPISLRNDFPDAWWELHNPDQTSAPHVVAFTTDPPDFPANVDDLEIEHLALMISARTALPPALTVRLRFAERAEPGGEAPPRTPWLAASPLDGVISTRRGNAGSWLSLLGRPPVGRWELSLPDTDEIREWFGAGLIDDILIVLSYRGRTRAWPS